MWLKFKNGDGFMFSLWLPQDTILEIERLWKSLMKQNQIPYFNIVANRLKEQFVETADTPGIESIKRMCKGCRISTFEKTGENEYTLRLKRKIPRRNGE